MKKKIFCLILALALLLGIARAEILVEDGVVLTDDWLMVEYGQMYFSYEEVALYLHVFCRLPVNYITKNDAFDLGWSQGDTDLWVRQAGACIGGDRFGNYEKQLPDAPDRTWYECDVNYYGGHRGADRLLYSSDGLIYYTNDHYLTFECLYEGWFENGIYGEMYADDLYD